MNTLNVHPDAQFDDDDDDFGDTEGRPLVVWLLMAVALVTMAFLLGSSPEALAHPVNAPAAAEPSPTVQALMRSEAAGLAYGG
jgi:hypothetical protein